MNLKYKTFYRHLYIINVRNILNYEKFGFNKYITFSGWILKEKKINIRYGLSFQFSIQFKYIKNLNSGITILLWN